MRLMAFCDYRADTWVRPYDEASLRTLVGAAISRPFFHIKKLRMLNRASAVLHSVWHRYFPNPSDDCNGIPPH